eukprot:TRINITY_DN19379_c0_g2_i1.p1 TRINITY_DN19379_c0_g2~~TRINITY_DN19379_c0_g2_i1.p1  ORF type:complete len:479 (-),score=99.20 TRINITY_DN19379_c0_g2_i1:328-1764(-)
MCIRDRSTGWFQSHQAASCMSSTDSGLGSAVQENTAYAPVSNINQVTSDDDIELDCLDEDVSDAEVEAACGDGTVLLGEDGSVAVVKEEGCTWKQACINTFISFVGAGILGLPGAFKSTGIALAVILLVGVAVTAYHSMTLLLSSKHRLLAQGHSNCNTYGDLSFATFGHIGFSVVQTSLLVTQTGFCCSYVIYIVECINALTGSSKNMTALAVVMCVLPLILLRHLKYLTNTSLMANIMNCSAFAVVYVFAGQSLISEGVPELRLVEHTGILHFLGIAVYCYEGIGLVLPLESSMEDKHEFPWVLRSSMLCVTALFLSFGFVGYLAYGEETNSLVTDNLPGGIISDILQIVLAIGLFFTYPIMMFPVSQILDDLLIDLEGSSGFMKQNLVRVVLGAVTGLVARSVPDFGLFISLVGSSCCALLAFVMPAAIHLECHREQMHWRHAASDIGVIVFGVLTAVMGTYLSILDIIAVAHNE